MGFVTEPMTIMSMTRAISDRILIANAAQWKALLAEGGCKGVPISIYELQ